MDGHRVLVIDDSLTIRALVEQLLANDSQRWTVALAPDVATARERIADFRPTLIVLDLAMPGINGQALLAELQGFDHAPILVVSSATKEGSIAADEAMALGAHACFDKSRIVSEARRFLHLVRKVAATKPRRPARRIDRPAAI